MDEYDGPWTIESELLHPSAEGFKNSSQAQEGDSTSDFEQAYEASPLAILDPVVGLTDSSSGPGIRFPCESKSTAVYVDTTGQANLFVDQYFLGLEHESTSPTSLAQEHYKRENGLLCQDATWSGTMGSYVTLVPTQPSGCMASLHGVLECAHDDPSSSQADGDPIAQWTSFGGNYSCPSNLDEAPSVSLTLAPVLQDTAINPMIAYAFRTSKSKYIIRCCEPQCGGRTFRCWGNFSRHDKAYHGKNGGKLWCPVPGCNRSNAKGNKGFPNPRKDKLKEHVRTVHPGYNGQL